MHSLKVKMKKDYTYKLLPRSAEIGPSYGGESSTACFELLHVPDDEFPSTIIARLDALKTYPDLDAYSYKIEWRLVLADSFEHVRPLREAEDEK